MKIQPHTPDFTENTPGSPAGNHNSRDIHIHILVQLSEKSIVYATLEHNFSMMRTESVTGLESNDTRLIAEVNTAQKPVLITQAGLPAAYLVDASTYESMETRIQLLQGIAKDERAIFDGMLVPHEEARKRFLRFLKR